MPVAVDASAVRLWCSAGLEALRRRRRVIDELNVYPVPDGDTGTNLVLTMGAACAAVEAVEQQGDNVAATPGGMLQIAARGALLGARGNSGVILAELLRGLAEALGSAAVADGPLLAKALDRASNAAYNAVAVPVEGTVLSVAAAAAAAVSDPAQDAAEVLTAAAAAGREALAMTPRQLPALAMAGVVDAGGYGLVLLLDAFVSAVTGRAAHEVPTRTVDGSGQATGWSEDPARYRYEVQYLLRAEPEAVTGLRARLSGLGDSLLIVRACGEDQQDELPIWNVHVHVDDIGGAIEAGIEAGRPYRISVAGFADQRKAAEPGADGARADGVAVGGMTPGGMTAGGVTGDGRTGDGRAEPAFTGPASTAASGADVAAMAGVRTGHGRSRPAAGAKAVLAICAGAGLRQVFDQAGASVLDDDVAGTICTSAILDAILDTGAHRVVVLPNDRDMTAVAAAAVREARATGVHAVVVPTRSPMQALAAMAVHDQDRAFEDDVIAMADAGGACRYGEVTIAARQALTVVGRCDRGDVLGLVDGEVNVIGSSLDEVGTKLLDRMLAGGGELVTMVTGQGAPGGYAEGLGGYLARRWPFVEVRWYEGGQPHYPLLVGVE